MLAQAYVFLASSFCPCPSVCYLGCLIRAGTAYFGRALRDFLGHWSDPLAPFPGARKLLKECEGEAAASSEHVINYLLEEAIDRFGYSESAYDVFNAVFNPRRHPAPLGNFVISSPELGSCRMLSLK